MTGWLALTLIVAAVIAVAAIFRFGRRASAEAQHAKAAEVEIQSLKEAADAQDRMLDASANAPRDRDDLIGRLAAGPGWPRRPAIALVWLDWRTEYWRVRFVG